MQSWLLLIIAISLPLILSLWKVRKSTFAKNTSDFYLANKSLDAGDFITTTVSYGYQVASLTLFATWGYQYGIGVVSVPLFWCGGFFLLKSLNNKKKLNHFFAENNGLTLHGYMAKGYNVKTLAVLAAFASILGLSGTAFFEADYSSKIISLSLFSSSSQHIWYIILFFFFVFVVLGYILLGGLITITITNKAQLNIGFIGYNLFMIYVLTKVVQSGYLYTAICLFVLSLFCILYLCWRYPSLRELYNRTNTNRLSPTLIIVLISYVIGAVYVIFIHSDNPKVIHDSWLFVFKSQNLYRPLAMGGFDPKSAINLLPILSLLLANVLWQVVDVSTWQRLAALNDGKIKKVEISRTISFIGEYSAVTWLIAIFFGMAIKYTGLRFLNDPNTDAFIQFSRSLFVSGTLIDLTFLTVLFISVIMIMMSTLDSIISVISYTVYSDVIRPKQKTLFGARLWTVVYTIVFMIIYYIVRLKLSAVDDILYTFYSFQLALFPAIICLLFGRKMSLIGVFTTIIAGMVATIIPLLINNTVFTPYTSAATFCVVASTLTTLFFKKAPILKTTTSE